MHPVRQSAICLFGEICDELRLAAELETTNRELRAQMTQRQKAEAEPSQAHQEEILRTRTLEQVSSQLKLLAEMSDLLTILC